MILKQPRQISDFLSARICIVYMVSVQDSRRASVNLYYLSPLECKSGGSATQCSVLLSFHCIHLSKHLFSSLLHESPCFSFPHVLG